MIADGLVSRRRQGWPLRRRCGCAGASRPRLDGVEHEATLAWIGANDLLVAWLAMGFAPDLDRCDLDLCPPYK